MKKIFSLLVMLSGCNWPDAQMQALAQAHSLHQHYCN